MEIDLLQQCSILRRPDATGDTLRYAPRQSKRSLEVQLPIPIALALPHWASGATLPQFAYELE